MRLRVLAVGVIALFAVAWRLVNAGASYAPNLELVTAATAATVATALLLPGSVSWAVPLLVVAISDALIGDTRIYLFTWPAWAVTILASSPLTRLRRRRSVVIGSTIFGIGSSTWFFMWTNFGVWAIGAGPSTRPPGRDSWRAMQRACRSAGPCSSATWSSYRWSRSALSPCESAAASL